MNEEQKNIETCLPEDILAEVAGVPQDAHFRSLVDEALDPLKQQAATQAGWDDYQEVVQSHQPYTFTSSVRQMKSNLILLLRRLWRFPFGRGTIRSLSDMWQHYIDRLQGNATYGIPSRLDQLTDLPSAPLLVADRKIICPQTLDGMNLARLTCDNTEKSRITEVIDDTTGWTYNSSTFFTIFTAIEKLKLGLRTFTPGQILTNYAALKELELSDIHEFNSQGNKGSSGWGIVQGCSGLKTVYMPEFTKYDTDNHSSNYEGLICDCSALEEFIAPKLGYIRPLQGYTDNAMLSKCGALKKVVVGTLTYVRNYEYSSGADSFINTDCPNLIHFEIGQGSECSIRMTKWSPTNALDASRTDLIEEGSTAANNLEQFLSNFRDYIAERLADNGAGKTITLSQAVRNAIHAAESTYGIENIIITQKGWTISPAPN